MLDRLVGWSGLGGDGTERPYECQTCGLRYDLRYYVCPGCGGHAVDRVVHSID